MESTTVIIREGQPSDAVQMADIFNYYITSSDVIFSNRLRSPEDMLSLVQPGFGQYPFFVAEDPEGRLLGYCFAHRWMPDEVYARTLEITIYLRHDALGLGIGGRLLDRVIEGCRRIGTHRLVSFITEGNRPCEQLHLRAGFTLRGILPAVGYKFGRYLNDAIYLKEL